jgi:hypothetical protein
MGWADKWSDIQTTRAAALEDLRKKIIEEKNN